VPIEILYWRKEERRVCWSQHLHTGPRPGERASEHVPMAAAGEGPQVLVTKV
jgi:hypothetical protein